MKVLFCSLSDRPDFSQSIFDQNQKYYDKYNFDFIYEDKTLCDQRHQSWSKILLLQRELKKDYDYVIWIDDDILIMNYDIDFRDIINKHDFENILIDDNDNNFGYKINCGMFICKNNDITTDMLKEVWDNAKPEHHFGGVWENETMQEYRHKYKIIKHRTFQSFTTKYKEGDFSIHFAGLSMKRRMIYRDEYLKLLNPK
tara:strand:+ start:1579 stop:2175 length:597 start_codon:yes stop_codon:yes gene_type:complete